MREYRTIEEWHAQQEAWARDFFPDHHITGHTVVADHGAQRSPIEILHWRKSGTSINAIRYELAGGLLIVTGDLGDAVYQWSERISVPFVAGCNLDYFASKCLASEHGRGYRRRCDHLARVEFADRMRDIEDDPEAYEDERAAVEFSGDFHDWTDDPQGYVREIYDRTGDGELAAVYADFGMAVSLRCRAHLIGLKMIHTMYGAGAL